ncbi:Uma2 family endonuclease [Aggregatilineales bacterium SYSU G02658]
MTEYIPEERITLDEYLQMERVEVVNGELVEMSATGGVHSIVSGNIYRSLANYLEQDDLGLAFTDGMTFLMHSGQPYLRDSFVPDAAFIRHENLAAEWDALKPYPGAPDFAVEVVSPHDRPEVLKTKLDTYLSKGTREVWRVYPTLFLVERHWQDETGERSQTVRTGRIDTGRFLPNWHITVEDVFRLPAWMKKQLGRSTDAPSEA